MNRLVFVFFLLLIVACTNKEKIPEGIMPPEKMEKVMWDMLQADRYAAMYLVRDTGMVSVQDETFKVYDQVFQIHSISKDQFLESFQFYLGRPDLSKKMFDSLSAEANRKKIEAFKRVPVE